MFVRFQSNAKINLPGCRKITNFDSLLETKTAYIIGFDTKWLSYGKNRACFIFTLVKTLLNPTPCGNSLVAHKVLNKTSLSSIDVIYILDTHT
jgi:hypothetical protein